MDVVSVKFQEGILVKIDDTISKHNFNSRTEFIREAVRDKLAILSKEELVNEFLKYNGKSKIKTSLKENKNVREEVSKEIIRELDKKFNL